MKEYVWSQNSTITGDIMQVMKEMFCDIIE